MIPNVNRDSLRRVEDKLDRLSFAVYCLLGYELAGPSGDRGGHRARLEEAVRALEPPGQVSVVSDPDASTGPSELRREGTC